VRKVRFRIIRLLHGPPSVAYAGRIWEEKIMAVEGAWDVEMKTRMGPQKGVLTINRAGGAFTGSFTSALGDVEIGDGKVDGDTLSWTMEVTKPIKLKMSGVAAVKGDIIEGEVDGGMLGGKMALNGTRKG
jgi:hypothetical protein